MIVDAETWVEYRQSTRARARWLSGALTSGQARVKLSYPMTKSFHRGSRIFSEGPLFA